MGLLGHIQAIDELFGLSFIDSAQDATLVARFLHQLPAGLGNQQHSYYGPPDAYVLTSSTGSVGEVMASTGDCSPWDVAVAGGSTPKR